MPKGYSVSREGITIADEKNSNLIIIKEARDSREDTEKEFIEEYDLPKDIFELTEFSTIAPRIEFIDNDYLGETCILVLSNVSNPGDKEINVDDRFESIILILSKEKLFVFIYEDSTIVDDLFENHKADIDSLESIVLYIAMDNYFNYIEELKYQKDRIDELNNRAEDASTEKALLKELTNTGRALVLLQHAVGTQENALNPLLETEQFTNNIEENLVYDVRWISRQARQLIDINRDLFEALSGHFTTLMSRNLNSLMKFLNSLSLVLSAGSLIFAIWGMSVGGLPGEQSNIGFWVVIIIAVIASIAMGIYLKNRDYS